MSKPRTKKPKPACSRAGCTNPVRAKGLCNAHYFEEWRRERGMEEAVTLGPEPRHLHFFTTKEQGDAIDALFGTARKRSAFLRRAIANQLKMEQASGKAVTL